MAGIQLTLDQVADKLRMFLGDTPEDNKLIPGFELSVDKLKLAIELTIDEFNNYPPTMTFTVATFPSLTVLIHGGAVQCLMMAGFIQARNYLQFADGGISEIINDKTPTYQAYIQQLTGLLGNYKQKSDEIKIAINMERAWGTIDSPYASLGWGGRGGWDG